MAHLVQKLWGEKKVFQDQKKGKAPMAIKLEGGRLQMLYKDNKV